MDTERGNEAAEEQEDSATTVSRRRRAIEDTAGVLTGVYPPGYLDQLRADWPD